MLDKTVSIIMPTLNANNWVGETLKSVIALNYPVELLEVIVVDDGSTDSTVDVVKLTLGGSRLRWRLLASAGRGPSAARNAGLAVCGTEWVQFLDADDLIDPNKLAVQLRTDSVNDPDVAVIYSPWQRWSVDPSGRWGGIGPVHQPNVGANAVEELISGGNFIATGSQIFRRPWLDRVGGFDENRMLIEDVHLALRIAMQGGLFVRTETSEPLFYYRQVPGSYSRRDPVGFYRALGDNAYLAQQFWEGQEGGITARQRELVLAEYASVMRGSRVLNVQLFDDVFRRARTLESGWLPWDRTPVVWLSRVMGYRTAEQFASHLVCIRKKVAGW